MDIALKTLAARAAMAMLAFSALACPAVNVSFNGSVTSQDGNYVAYITQGIVLSASVDELDITGIAGDEYTGAPSLEYRWFVNDVLIGGTTGTALALSDGHAGINGPAVYDVRCDVRVGLQLDGGGWLSEWMQVGTRQVTFFDFNITEPNENTVFLKGQEIRFAGTVHPSGLNGVSYAWTVVSGNCSPATSNSIEFTPLLASEGIISVKFTVTVSGVSAYKTRSVRSVLPEVTQISWKNDHSMTKWTTGQAITDPVWIKTLGGNVTKDEPGAYTKSTHARAELAISGSLPLSQATHVEVRGVGNKENFQSASAVFHYWNWNSGELQLDSSQLYSSVNYYDKLEVNWQYRLRRLSGDYGDWISMNTSSHILYTVDATPAASPLYDLGLDKACRYADGAANFANAINQGIANEIIYNPSCEVYGHGLNIFTVGTGQCCCHADAFSVLVSHVTSSVPIVLYCWGGCSSSYFCHYKMGTWHGPTFRCQRPAEDQVEANPHFTFHAQALFNNVMYDPSYGLTGWASLNEFANPTPDHPVYGTFQSGTSLPPNTNRHFVDWTCPHVQ